MYPQTNLKLKFSTLETVVLFFDVVWGGNFMYWLIYLVSMKLKYFLIEIFILRNLNIMLILLRTGCRLDLRDLDSE